MKTALDVKTETDSGPKAMSARDRILSVASELFYESGIRAVGIDTIVAKSGVAKTSLYRHFASKDDLVAAYLAKQEERFWLFWERAATLDAPPRDRLMAVFHGCARYLASEEYRRCPFLSTASEFLLDDLPGRTIWTRQREKLRRNLIEMVRETGVAAPEELGDALMLLMEGSFASSQTLGTTGPAASLVRSAEMIIGAAKI